jgi:DNA-binding transcriptional MerR regulator
VSEIPNKLFYKIGEVCQYTDTQPYVLRFWESEFPLLAPQKNRSGQRIYSREDIDLVFKIKQLLYDEEYTIAGARKQLEQEDGGEGEEAPSKPSKASGRRGAKGKASGKAELRAIRKRAAREEPRPEPMPTRPAPTAASMLSESQEIEGLERRLADMEQRWRRAEIALEAAEAARNEADERCDRAAAKLEKALEAIAALKKAVDEG